MSTFNLTSVKNDDCKIQTLLSSVLANTILEIILTNVYLLFNSWAREKSNCKFSQSSYLYEYQEVADTHYRNAAFFIMLFPVVPFGHALPDNSIQIWNGSAPMFPNCS